MSAWSPPSLSRRQVLGIVLAYAFVLAYAVLVQGQFFSGLLFGVVLATAYVVWRFLVALEAVAAGVHRIADQRERE